MWTGTVNMGGLRCCHPYLLSHGVGSTLKALIGRRAEVAVPWKVEHSGAEADERLGNSARQLSSVVVTWRHCTVICGHVKRANSLPETDGRDRCETVAIVNIYLIQQNKIIIN